MFCFAPRLRPTRAQFFLPERVRPGLLCVPTAGVGGVLSDLEPFRLNERHRARGLCAGGLRLGNSRYKHFPREHFAQSLTHVTTC